MSEVKEGYDPRKSKVKDETMEQWTMSQVVADITTVPGIGPATAEKLQVDDDFGAVQNTYQLFAKWMSMHQVLGDEDIVQEPSASLTNQKFWFWLKAKGINAQRSAIVKAVSDKLGSFMNQLRPEADDDDDDDEEE